MEDDVKDIIDLQEIANRNSRHLLNSIFSQGVLAFSEVVIHTVMPDYWRKLG